MGIKKKKYILYLTLVVIVMFIVYQITLFYKLSNDSYTFGKIISPQELAKETKAIISIEKTKEDEFINSNGIIRGVHILNMPKYKPNKENTFKCLSTDMIIPFEQVNDDFCDCSDNSDEPSTSACVNGIFYCDTQLQNKANSLNYIPSSRLNDGICDCCDGSDEWLSKKVLTQYSSNGRKYAKECLDTCYDQN